LTGIANIECDIVLPDGRIYEYYVSSVDSDTGIYTFKIQPYVKAREAGFVFGSAIVYATGRVRMRDLILYGFLYGLIANTLIVTLLIPYWIRILTQ